MATRNRYHAGNRALVLAVTHGAELMASCGLLNAVSRLQHTLWFDYSPPSWVSVPP